MAKKQTRRSVSVSGAAFAKLRAWCARRGVSMSSTVEHLVSDAIDDAEMDDEAALERPSDPAPPVAHAPPPIVARDPIAAIMWNAGVERDRAYAERQLLTARVLAAPGPRLRTAIDVDEGTAQILDDLVVRERQLRGRTVTDAELLDDAINRFLDYQRWPRAAIGGAA